MNKRNQDLPGTRWSRPHYLPYELVAVSAIYLSYPTVYLRLQIAVTDAECSLVISPHSKYVLSVSRWWRSQEELFRQRREASRSTALKLLKCPYSVLSWSTFFRRLDDDQWRVVTRGLRLHEPEIAVSTVWPKLSWNLTSFVFPGRICHYISWASDGRQQRKKSRLHASNKQMEGQEVLEANKFTKHLIYPHKQDFKTFVFLNLSTLVVELQIM